MGLFQRLNDLVLKRIRESSGEVAVRRVIVRGMELSLELSNGEHRPLDLRHLARAAAFKHDVYAGTEIALLLEGENPSQAVQIPESCSGFHEVCLALERVPGTAAYAAWYPRLLADDGESAVEILPETST